MYNPLNVDKVVAGVNEELGRLIRDGVKAPELEKAKTGYLQNLHVQRTRDAALAGSLAENLYLGRTMQFQADLEQKIKTLTPQAVDARTPQAPRTPNGLSVVKPRRTSGSPAGDLSVKKK